MRKACSWAKGSKTSLEQNCLWVRRLTGAMGRAELYLPRHHPAMVTAPDHTASPKDKQPLLQLGRDALHRLNPSRAREHQHSTASKNIREEQPQTLSLSLELGRSWRGHPQTLAAGSFVFCFFVFFVLCPGSVSA